MDKNTDQWIGVTHVLPSMFYLPLLTQRQYRPVFLLVTSPPVMGGVGRNGLLMPEYQHAAAAPGMPEAASGRRYSGDSAGNMADSLAVIYKLLLFPFGWA